MMFTFKAKGGTEFFYDPALETGEVWITTPDDVVQQFAVTAIVPLRDLIQFTAHLVSAAVNDAPEIKP